MNFGGKVYICLRNKLSSYFKFQIQSKGQLSLQRHPLHFKHKTFKPFYLQLTFGQPLTFWSSSWPKSSNYPKPNFLLILHKVLQFLQVVLQNPSCAWFHDKSLSWHAKSACLDAIPYQAHSIPTICTHTLQNHTNIHDQHSYICALSQSRPIILSYETQAIQTKTWIWPIINPNFLTRCP